MIREILLGAVLLMFAKPLLAPISYAAILSITLYPIYRLHKKKYFAATLIFASTAVLIYVFYSFSITLFDQISYIAELSSHLNPEIQVKLIEFGSNIPFTDYAIAFAKSLPATLGKLAFFFLFSFYFLIDGHKISESLYKIMPKAKAEKLIEEGWYNLRSVVTGVFVTKFLYILISTTLLHFTGSPSPLVYSIIAALFGILPIFGAWMVYGYIVYLQIMAGNFFFALVLIAFQVIWDVLFEMAFKIKFRGTLHPAILLGSMASGIAYFGFSGLVIGPMIATGLMTLARVRD